MKLEVREMEFRDIKQVADYWFTAEPDFLENMGVDVIKVPERQPFEAMLEKQLALPYSEKKAYALVWEADNEPIGYCNLNPAVFGDHGFMHLHIWKPEMRKMGFGEDLVRMSVPWFFKNMDLRVLYCEPYALNPAPNRTLEKCGFKFVREYVTTPGSITFEQHVNRWEMGRP